MVAKLSSARIIWAAPLATSVPVMPMAMPMSAAPMAGASLTPSPVIATTLCLALSTSTSRTLCSGATRAITPMSSIWRAASSSSSAANSAPVTARPSIPSSWAIACAVIAWSPVIIRTRMPALRASAMALVASARGGSTSPTSATISRSCISGIGSAEGSNLPGSNSRWANPRTRRPCPAIRSFSAVTRARMSSVSRSVRPPGIRAKADRSRITSGAPLTYARTTGFPDSPGIVWNVAMNL